MVASATHRLLMLTLTEPDSKADEFGGTIDRLLDWFNRLTHRRLWNRALLHWFRALEVTPARTGTYPRISTSCWWCISTQARRSTSAKLNGERCGRRAFGQPAVRSSTFGWTESPGEVAKYVTKPGHILSSMAMASGRAIPTGYPSLCARQSAPSSLGRGGRSKADLTEER